MFDLARILPNASALVKARAIRRAGELLREIEPGKNRHDPSGTKLPIPILAHCACWRLDVILF